MELNVIETNRFFLQKEGVNRIVLRYKIGTQSDRKSQKWGSSPRNLPTMPKYGSTPRGLLLRSLNHILYKSHIPVFHVNSLISIHLLIPFSISLSCTEVSRHQINTECGIFHVLSFISALINLLISSTYYSDVYNKLTCQGSENLKIPIRG